ncbi:FtsX-like permease family protein [Sutcliffiella rhizosphaerae]|uniref:ABC transporter permease protein YxdM n=1 Tax=Sutcliffiella rhizosphaerae TaxID=2880967 RepID=A0ABN8A8T7_9BACI|nr:ABC transporter permease [Sutcliffiella rhizosphaerae]CAG9621579.1 ABC transporter permease protein YxdM [Sutcliffiella rhizosphaerae]
MTFNQLIWKMAKENKKKYIFYFLCNSFAVTFFFLFATIYFNQAIIEVKELEGIQDILIIPGVALVFFTVFFINYAHRIFIKRRKKELSLLMTLGMSNQDILKLILKENGAIALGSIVTGLTTGLVFSRLFFMILIESVGLDRVPFHLSFNMFGYTIGTYILVFALSIAMTIYFLLSKSLTESLKSDRYVENLKHRSPIMGGLGILLLVGSCYLLYFTFLNPELGGDDGTFLLMWTIGIIIGLCITISQCMSFFVHTAKRFPSYYFSRSLFFSSIENKFRNLTAILVLVSIMSMVTIFYTSFCLYFLKYQEDQVERDFPYHLSYVETDTSNNIFGKELNTIVDNKDNSITNHVQVDGFMYKKLYQHWDDYYEDYYRDYLFISLSSFNELSNQQISLSDDDYFYLVNSNSEYYYVDEEYSRGIQLEENGSNFEFTLKDVFVEKMINRWHTNYLVVTDQTFEKIKKSLNGIEMSIHLMNVTDWKNSGAIINEFEDKLNNKNNSSQPDGQLEDYWYEIDSKLHAYNTIKYTNGTMFFVTIFISILFFLGSFILLYLNVFSNVDEEKRRFLKLYKIGITKKEVKQLISKELRVILFFAPILGSCLAFVYILSFAKDGGGLLENMSLFYCFLIMSGIYFSIQIIYYFIARKKLLEQVM